MIPPEDLDISEVLSRLKPTTLTTEEAQNIYNTWNEALGIEVDGPYRMQRKAPLKHQKAKPLPSERPYLRLVRPEPEVKEDLGTSRDMKS